MGVLLKNNAVSRLGSSIASGATSLSVTTGQGSLFPSPGAGEWFPVTLIKASGSLEIVRCTARSGDVLTVVRAQEGTAAQAFTAGDRVELRLTADAINDFINSDEVSTYMLSVLLAIDQATARTSLGLGDAATKTVQTSATDATAGRLMPVGAFGLGASTTPVISDLNVALNAGFYLASANATGLPPAIATAGAVVLMLRLNFAIVIEVAVSGTRRVYHGARTGATGAFTWFRIIDDSQVTAFALTLLDDADDTAARATLGLVKTVNSSDANAGRIPKNGDKQVCNAWVNFNGVGTPAIRDGFNVASVVRVGTGNYTVNFGTAMDNATYSVSNSFDSDADNVNAFAVTASTRSLYIQESLKTTSGFRVLCGANSPTSSTTLDFRSINLQVFGGKP